MFKNPVVWNSFNRALGDHVFMHLLHSKIKKEIYGDTAICCHLFQNDMVSIFPTISLVRNMGHDGSGLHCGKTLDDLFSNQLVWDQAEKRTPEITYVEMPIPDAAFQKILKEYFRRPISRKLFYYARYLAIGLLKKLN